jgi:hypothetical protein
MLSGLLNKDLEIASPELQTKRKQNCFVSHYGLVSKWGQLDCSSAPNIFPDNDINHYGFFQKQVMIQEFTCRWGKSLTSRKLSDDFDYIVIHHKWFGYFFWITCYLSRLERALSVVGERSSKLIVSERWANTTFVAQSLALFKVDTIVVKPDEHLWVPNLILPACRPASAIFHPLHTRKIRDYIKNALLTPNEMGIKPFRKTFIYRKQSALRTLINENEVLKIVESMGFAISILEEMSFAEQVRCIHESEIVMGLHGAGLANAMFMQKGSTLIECIETEFAHYAHPFPFRNLCAAVGVNYAAIATVKDSVFRGGLTSPWRANPKMRLELVNSAQYLDINELRKALDAIEKNK